MVGWARAVMAVVLLAPAAPAALANETICVCGATPVGISDVPEIKGLARASTATFRGKVRLVERVSGTGDQCGSTRITLDATQVWVGSRDMSFVVTAGDSRPGRCIDLCAPSVTPGEEYVVFANGPSLAVTMCSVEPTSTDRGKHLIEVLDQPDPEPTPPPAVVACVKIPIDTSSSDPVDRFDKPLGEALQAARLGEVTGGTVSFEDKAAPWAATLVALTDEKEGLAFLKATVARLGVPKGSIIQYKAGERFAEVPVYGGLSPRLVAPSGRCIEDDRPRLH